MLLEGRYQLQDPIGRGGMAIIYRGQDLKTGRSVAVKILRETYSADSKFVTRFQHEAKVMIALQHPNVVQVYGYGHTDGYYFIVKELVAGTDLHRYLRVRGVLGIDDAISIVRNIILGLEVVHQHSIVHRNIKPQGILIGNDGSIKLTDVGIANIYKAIDAERLTTTSLMIGCIQYYAPEQVQGANVSPATDIYALGIVMYEMLTGCTPFNGDTPIAMSMQHIHNLPVPPRQLNSNIPAALEQIILRCLGKVPAMRFSNSSEMLYALKTLSKNE